MKKSITIISTTLLSAAFVFVSCKQKAAQTNSYNMADSSAYYNNPANGPGINKQPVAAYPTTTRTHRSYASRSSYSVQSTTVRKKGWSSAAKGTAIGAGSGAVLGAVVAGDHNRVKGAVVGGVVGAAGGYIYGRHRDKTHKRY